MQIQGFSSSYFSHTSSSMREDKDLSSNSTYANEEDSKNEVQTELSEAEKRVVQELQATDTKVKAHEMAHMAAGGGLAGSASYTYERGPDNKMYAVAGEVPISMQEGRTPEETIANARQIQAAAMAPADPSPQDFKVAASAMRMEIEARAEKVKIEAEERSQEQAEQEEDETKNQDLNNKNQLIKAYEQDNAQGLMLDKVS
ncbi:hypothetical protein DMB92_07255 [Campylobacter sp. MIT 99-7217]|uniref:putative metalloprotease CJM1_0395 family protein n=1 Tax=Campylobacter sp. MIT 99-7217 TaxID=535091 RepID=UPI00115A65D1|nr:putative metalloprotease CJM1_0395 family protein [Campylobacter sp. MIT 99-7217]TQR30609.1 hypothetical protein DMB92_07255 [Campylobacter sp. MIT 99-7217]